MGQRRQKQSDGCPRVRVRERGTGARVQYSIHASVKKVRGERETRLQIQKVPRDQPKLFLASRVKDVNERVFSIYDTLLPK
jgi:hypothetical protein